VTAFDQEFMLLAQYTIAYLIVVQFQAGQNPYEEKCSHCDQFPWRTASVDDRHLFQKRRQKCFIRYEVKYPRIISSLHHCEGKTGKGDNCKRRGAFQPFQVSPFLHEESKMSYCSLILAYYEPCLSSRSINIKPHLAKLSCGAYFIPV
jgi:hypothetical protein